MSLVWLYFLCSWLQIALISSQRWTVPQVSGTQNPAFSTTTWVMWEMCFALATSPTHLPLPVYQKVWTPLTTWHHLKCKIHFSFKQQLCRNQHLMLIPVDNLRSKLSKLPSLCSTVCPQGRWMTAGSTSHSTAQILPPISTNAVPID